MLFLPKNFIKGNANMSNRKQTKRALLTSIMALVMCVVMLVGTTFAWFTDTASTNVNKIEAGKLDVQMLDKGGNDLEGKTLNWVKAEGGKNQQVLWEPGCSYDLESFKIKNNGNLKLKYKVLINGLIGNAELLKAIDFTVAVANPALTPKDGTSTVSTVAGLNSFEGTLDAGAETGLITITGKMKTDAGNTYQGKTIDGIAITVYAAQMTGEYDSSVNNYDEDATYDYTFVADSSEAETALSANEKNIYVALAGDVSFDVNVSATPSKLLGGADTELIVIEGHGHKLTFHNSNNDSGAVSRAGTKLVIKNAVIDNSGYNAAGGVWNSHDIVFNGEVELENVTFTNAVALNGKATLTNVQISDQNAAQDTYMLWIRAGSDVTLNNVTIDGKSAVGKANRAIAIKDEYIDNPTETTLTVNGLTATSDKYAAIYVTSKSATTINLNGVIDVTGTKVNDRVVQKDSSSTGEITVSDNSTKVVKAATQEELKNAITAVEVGKSAKVELGEGTYTLYNVAAGKTKNTSLVIEGAGKDSTVFTAGDLTITNASGEGSSDYSYENSEVVFKDMTINVGTGDYKGFVRAKSLYFENCKIVGRGSYWGVGSVVFKNCEFADNAGDYNIWTYAGTDFTFDGCTFNSSFGKFINAYKEQRVDSTLNFIKCSFNYTGSGTASKPAVCLKSYTDIVWTVTFMDCTSNAATDSGTGSNLYSIEAGMNVGTSVTVNNSVVWENGAKK